MSLINEALKKAKTAGAGTGVADGPELQPVETGARAGRTIFTLPFLIAVVLVLGGIMIWAWYQSGKVIVVRGNSSATIASPVPRVSEPVTTVAPVPPAAAQSAVPSTEAPAASAPAATGSADAGSANVLAAAVEAPKPTGPEYKLEGIFYNPKRPSAVINGDLVYVGSRVEDGSVVAIDSESATVVTSAGQTNLLVLTR